MAEQAIKAGIVEILPLVSAADKPGNTPLSGWLQAIAATTMTCAELGIDIEKFETMPVENRPSFIMQKRVKMLTRIVLSCLFVLAFNKSIVI
jgi:tRNA nucleotidyltransferase (CCA-adding enzyme)